MVNMRENVFRYSSPRVVCRPKGDVTNMVYDGSGLGISPPCESESDDNRVEKDLSSETVSTTNLE